MKSLLFYIIIILTLFISQTHAIEITQQISNYMSNNYRYVNDVEIISKCIQKYSKEFDLDPVLITALISIESSFNKDACSKKYHARGLMQVRFVVWKDLLRKNDILNHIQLHDIDDGIKAGCIVLQYYINKCDSLKDALWEYNGKLRINGIKKYTYSNKILKRYQEIERSF